MSNKFRTALGALTVVLALGLVGSVPAEGQGRPAHEGEKPPVGTKEWVPPRIAGGQPDLQGVWLNNKATPLERPKALEGKPFLTDEEVADLKRRADRIFKDGNADIALGDTYFLTALANPEKYRSANGSQRSSVYQVEKEFDNRTSLIVDPPDGRIPASTPDAQQRRAASAAKDRAAAGPDDLNNNVRCISPGLPRIGGTGGDPLYGYYQIFQSPGYVVLLMETFHDARIIPLDGRPHLPGRVRQWSGDSRGRWDGNTLLVDTTNFSPKSNFMGSAANLHLVERFTRTTSDTIRYEVTVDDPTTWVKPWTAVVHLKQLQAQIFEYACHEGNTVPMLGILAGARLAEEAPPAKKETK